MRTTVTLDADVEQMLREAMHSSRRNFKQSLNAALRAALSGTTPKSSAKPFKVRARPLRLRRGLDPSRLNQLADELEVEAFLKQAARPKKK